MSDHSTFNQSVLVQSTSEVTVPQGYARPADMVPQERTGQLLAVSTALGGAITTAQVVDVIIAAVLPLFQASVGLVALLSEDGSTLDCERIVGVPPAEADKWHSFAADAPVPLADAVRERRLIALLSDEAHHAAYPALDRERAAAGEGAVACVPFVAGDRCLGGIGMICPPERCQEREQQAFLWALAGQCALALARARLYDNACRAAEEMRAAHTRAAEILASTADGSQAVERGRRERFLADLAERARGLTDPDDVIADAVRSAGEFLGVSRCIFADIDIEADTCTVQPDYRADPSSPSIEGVVPISAFGPYVVAEYATRRAVAVDDVRTDPIKAPPENVAAYEAIGIRAHVTVPVVHTGRIVSCMSIHNTTPRHWKPEEIELLRAVVEWTWLTVEVLRQQYALAREAEALRAAHQNTTSILESITDAFMAFDAQWRFTFVNDQSEQVMGRGREDLLGKSFWDEFPAAVGSTFEREYRRAVDEQISVTFEEFYPPLGLWVEVRAYPSADGLSVFYQDVTARKQAQEERERLLAEQQARAEREALLNRIGLALRSSPGPEQVLAAAVRELGQALAADRCYYVAYDQEADTATVGTDWQRAGLPTLAGQYAMSRFAMNSDPVYRAGRTQVLADTSGDAAALELGLRAVVRVPLVSGVSMTALSAAMTGGPRDWTPDEVALVEAVATQTQTALEVRVQRREHQIAEQLQAALQPELPQSVAGLKLANYYEAALEEAGVGGDFYDCFPLEKGRIALVVGDLSGKGLAAAAQVATVRNMLRAFLYSLPTVAEAIAELNRTLSENNLLTGFTTLFVGAYDSGARMLSYVNCGQEPALVRRGATGAVEPLAPTGPVLGSIESAQYAEETARLRPGDALAIFSDGMTEVGPRRTQMLGIEGVTALFAEAVQGQDTDSAQGMAEHLVRRLVAGVDTAAQGGVMRDDVCLLVAVAE